MSFVEIGLIEDRGSRPEQGTTTVTLACIHTLETFKWNETFQMNTMMKRLNDLMVIVSNQYSTTSINLKGLSINNDKLSSKLKKVRPTQYLSLLN